MRKDRFRVWLFRGILVVIVLILLEALGYLGLWFNSRSTDWLSNKNYFNIRAMLSGDESPEMLPRFLTLPYLGYISFPGYEKDGVLQHNEDGYRGTKVHMTKKRKFRVVCLGGSTTYGFGVVSPHESFPAQLEILLNNYIKSNRDLFDMLSGAEVINAGLDAATSAEELQHYLFKYRYYKPDAVLIHSGINDAQVAASTSDGFQLDYTHYRRINFHLEALSKPMRWFMKSNLISFFVIRLIYNKFSVPGDEFKHQHLQKYCKWTEVKIDSVINYGEMGFYPFYRNSKSLYQEVISDSCYLVVLPNILNEKDEQVKSGKRYRELSELNIALSQQLCSEYKGVYHIKFSYDSISNQKSWIDDCHLDAAGEMEKAAIIFPYFKDILNQYSNRE